MDSKADPSGTADDLAWRRLAVWHWPKPIFRGARRKRFSALIRPLWPLGARRGGFSLCGINQISNGSIPTFSSIGLDGFTGSVHVVG